jgi:hypothetical protein
MIDKRWNPKTSPPEKWDFILNSFLVYLSRNKQKPDFKFLQTCRASPCYSNITDDLNGIDGIPFGTILGTSQIFLVALFFLMCWVQDQPRRQTADYCSCWYSNVSVELHVSWCHLSRRYFPCHWRGAGGNLSTVNSSVNFLSCVCFLNRAIR